MLESGTLSVEEGSHWQIQHSSLTEVLHCDFCHTLMLHAFTLAFNYSRGPVVHENYNLAFDKDQDAEYDQLSETGILNALAVLW